MVHHLHVRIGRWKYETTDKTTVHGVLGDHLHLFNHQDIQWLAGAFHCQNSIGHHACEVVRELHMRKKARGHFFGQFGAKRCTGYIIEGFVVVLDFVHRFLIVIRGGKGYSKGIEELERFLLGELKAVS